MTAHSETGKVAVYLCTCILLHYMLLFQVQTVNCQTYNPSNGLLLSTLPFCIDVPRPLRIGQIIKIMGFAEKDAIWLNINLCSECRKISRMLLLTLKFDEKIVSRSYSLNGRWGEEEKDGPFPFSSDAQFTLLIDVQSNGYMITGNGLPLWMYRHQLPYADVSSLNINGGPGRIRKIELIDRPTGNKPESSQIIYPVPLLKPVSNPTIPFWAQFPEGLEIGKAIRIQGFIPSRIDRFTINLCADCSKGPVMLHMDVRFKFSIDENKVVRNVLLDDQWKFEERDGPFPFGLREAFTLIIEVEHDNYNIKVNGRELWRFQHRLPFTEVTSLTIERGPVDIWKVEYIDYVSKTSEEITASQETKEILRAQTSVEKSSKNDSSTYHSTVCIITFVTFICLWLLT